MGSEMCIRDRPNGVSIDMLPLAEMQKMRKMVRGTDTGGQGARGCLLYTSDAADDLLCVDLGGRRIIKTKQNNAI